ncbi:universal stress protein [Flavobacterium sp. NRK F10]|uniref:universal stress protein n=1 Tax=Flavobacterium sp. NRK F10 TaxID=2954931 RepID=UPI002091926D|nr:universal stress protein [Flavobacterium sp. NRK F10]MCO6175132.1 universal stress protein [Flavobacterium sp. NRK F10]
MKRILVPTDFSQHAEYALKVAAQIAQKNNGEIFLVHMLELPTSGNDAISTAHEMPELMLFKNAAIAKLDTLMSAPYLNDLKVTKIIQFEMAFSGIIRNAEEHKVDLIVMGSHGASGFQEMFIGSNSEKVVRNSEIPVLIIKKEDDNFNVDHFVFASDFSDEIKKPFEKVVDFANEFNAHLHLVTINTPNNFKSTRVAQKIMDEFASNFKIHKFSTHIYNDINVEKGILHFAKEVNADLIGMSTHGRKGISHFFNGSISEDLVNHAKRPVVTFRI